LGQVKTKKARASCNPIGQDSFGRLIWILVLLLNRSVFESMEAICLLEEYLLRKAEHKIKAKYSKKVAPEQMPTFTSGANAEKKKLEKEELWLGENLAKRLCIYAKMRWISLVEKRRKKIPDISVLIIKL
jgi:hypothetical protein